MKNHEEKKILAELIELSKELLVDITNVASKTPLESETDLPGTFFSASYQKWYSEARQFISRILPARLAEFDFLYLGDPRRKTVCSSVYTIRNWLLDAHNGGNRTATARMKEFSAAAFKRFRLQCLILESAEGCFGSPLFSADPVFLDLDNGTRDVPFEQDYLRFLTAASNVFIASKELLFDGPEADRFDEILVADLEKTGDCSWCVVNGGLVKFTLENHTFPDRFCEPFVNRRRGNPYSSNNQLLAPISLARRLSLA